MPPFLLLLIVGIGLICIGRYAATPPIATWCFGAGVFLCALALILFLYGILSGGALSFSLT